MIINTAIILAAGRGTRLNTKFKTILPKPLITINDVPIIDYVMKNVLEIGITRIIMVLNYKSELIIKYIDENYKQIEKLYVFQETLSGIADAINLCKPFIYDSFFVFLGDEINFFKNSSDFLNLYEIFNPILIEGYVHEEDIEVIKRTNEVNISGNNKISHATEKPKKPQYLNRGVGIYLFNIDIFKYIDLTPVSKVRNEREITDTIDIVAKKGKAIGIELQGSSFNINISDDIDKVKNYIEKRKDIY